MQRIVRTLNRCALLVVSAAFIAACNTTPAATPTPDYTPTPEGITAIEPPIELSTYSLVDMNGEIYSTDSLNGKPSLVTFGYTHCPDVCPITLGYFRQVKDQLGEQAADINFVFVTVDVARDTPERLREYVGFFDPTFIGLTGEEDTIRQMINNYGGLFSVENAGGLKKDYLVTHTSSSFLVDVEGGLIRKYTYGTDPAILTSDIRGVLGS
jgi:protein SCO1